MGMEMQINDNEGVERSTRIFVGGLGEHVSDDDLRKMFSSLGRVEGLEIIRTKERSIAYCDFFPSSSKSLPKLFSTYNGCVWKGGKLRLDKAKEHYLIRMKREWEEDAQIASNEVNANESTVVLEKPKKIPDKEREQIRMFFPKLRKVKALPFSGTGKHKYSFRHIQVPTMPVHFCDCEEHALPSYTANANCVLDAEPQSGEMTEEEFNMMNSVMNKLFERHNISKAASDLVEDGDRSIKSTDCPLPYSDDSEDVDVDNDDLIINIGTPRRNRVAIPRSLTPNQETGVHKLRTSNDEPNHFMHSSQKKKDLSSSSNKKQKINSSEESIGNNSVCAIPRRKQNLRTNLNELETSLEVMQTGAESGARQLTGRSWSRKSSWKKLDGDDENSSFSISNVLLDNSSVKKKQKESSIPKPVNISYKTAEELVQTKRLLGQSNKAKGLKEFKEDEPTKSNGVIESSKGVSSLEKASTPSSDERVQESVQSKDVKEQTGKSNELEKHEEAKASKSNEVKISRGASWFQKCSWTQLVGGTNDSSFSLSQIVPSITIENQLAPKTHSLNGPNAVDGKDCKVANQGTNELTRDGSKSMGTGGAFMNAPKSSNTGVLHVKQNLNDSVQQKTSENSIGNGRSTNEVSDPSIGKRVQMAPKKKFIRDIVANETCSFMCSASSMREWSSAKAALSGSRRRKPDEIKPH